MDSASAALGDPFVRLREPSRTFDCGSKKIPHWGLPMLLSMWNSISGPTKCWEEEDTYTEGSFLPPMAF